MKYGIAPQLLSDLVYTDLDQTAIPSRSQGRRCHGCVLGAARPAHAQDAKTPYPTMAPLDQYLMPDRNAEIAFARTAAPSSISQDATVMVLTSHGFETGAEGKNGFVCIVERAWTSPLEECGVLEP